MSTLGEVTITATNPPAKITLLLGDTAPAYDGGYGGWETIERPNRRPITSWKAIPARTLELTCVLDDYAAGRSVEARIAALEQVATGSANTAPPEVAVSGLAIPGTSLRWVISELTWGAVEANSTGERTRANVTIKLAELLDDELLRITNPAKVRKPSVSRTYRVKKGDTLTRIAARQLGDANKWRAIAKLNIRKGHPRSTPKDVVVGELLKLP
jgi:hypothetical protein